MDDLLLRALLSNTLLAAVLAIVGWLAWRVTRLAPLARGLWLPQTSAAAYVGNAHRETTTFALTMMPLG